MGYFPARKSDERKQVGVVPAIFVYRNNRKGRFINFPALISPRSTPFVPRQQARLSQIPASRRGRWSAVFELSLFRLRQKHVQVQIVQNRRTEKRRGEGGREGGKGGGNRTKREQSSLQNELRLVIKVEVVEMAGRREKRQDGKSETASKLFNLPQLR